MNTKRNYIIFGIMILVSTAAMYAMMFFNVFQLSHVHWSQTRFFMALMMGAGMAIIMLAFMWKMYKNKVANIVILCVSIAVFAASLFMVRSQTGVGDTAWMRAMIPHHSIAILTSERADLTDPEVRELAEEIIESQHSEIAQMEDLIERLETTAE